MTYEIILISTDDAYVLDAEKELLEVLFADQIDNGTVVFQPLHASKLTAHALQWARRSQCHLLIASAAPRPLQVDNVDTACLTLDAPAPSLSLGDAPPLYAAEDTPLASWSATLERLLASWI